jgi:microcystin-dependent protein
MSFFRAKNRAVNKNIHDANRLAEFNKPTIKKGDLYVENNQNIGGELNVGGDLKARNYYASGNYYLNNYILIPYGAIIQSAAVNIPDGWLLCDGSSLLKVDYTNLFNAIGTTYGGSDLTNYFNIPNLNKRVIVGAITNNTDVSYNSYKLAGTGGEEKHTLTISEIPSHTHKSNANSDGTARLITSTGNNTAYQVDSSSGEPDLYAPLQTLSIYATGGGKDHNNMQPYIALYYLIKY